VITPVAMDHMGYLGDTLALIASEKAGILKAGAPAVIARQLPESLAVIEARAAAVGAPLYHFDTDWRVAERPTGFRFEGRRWRLDLPAPALLGRHQIENAATAIATLECLGGFNLSPEAVAEGLRTVAWPARLQHLTHGPLVAALPAGWELWLDGAHNPHAGEMLAGFLGGWRDRPVHLIVGMQATKDAGQFLGLLASAVRDGLVRTVTVPEAPAAIAAPDLAEAARQAGLDARPDAS
jgi:dihydrofolate synthase / folylpolyglutamate synthase